MSPLGALLAEGVQMLQMPDLCAWLRTIVCFVGAEKLQPLSLPFLLGLSVSKSPLVAFLLQQNTGTGGEGQRDRQLVNISVNVVVFLFLECYHHARGKKKKGIVSQ